MLKAYSYIEAEHLDVGIVDERLLKTEKKIISEFVHNNPTPKQESPCVICGEATVHFAMIDDVYYKRCTECLSIYADVKKEIIENFQNHQPLLDFRNSSEYQNSASEKRKAVWDELLFWISYRLARYLPNHSKYDIIDVGNRYHELTERISSASFCESYNEMGTGDVVLYFDQLRCQAAPMNTLQKLHGLLRNDGILIMSTRVGSGFDVLTMKGSIENIFPYESIFLPSIEGLGIMLQNAGFNILETSTPGTLDIEHVLKNKDLLDTNDLFVHYLLNKTDRSVLTEFQRFLQKSGISSHARVIARKRP